MQIKTTWLAAFALFAALTSSAVAADEMTIIKAGTLFDSKTGRISRDAIIVIFYVAFGQRQQILLEINTI